MSPYAVYVHEKVLIEALPSGNTHKLVLQFIRDLADDPFQKGDFQDRDEAGHELEIKVVGSLAITYWVDLAVREVKVINLQGADEG
ncbi:MAG: hypothetical protein QM496_02495 [Verrucomicrobiota bacterium]